MTRDNMLWFGFIFFAALSVLLFLRQLGLRTSEAVITTLPQSWLDVVSIPSLRTYYGELADTTLPKVAVLIVADMRYACNACIFAEAEEWQAFLQNTTLPSETVWLICNSPTPKRTFWELEALGVRFPVLFDTTGQIFQRLHIHHPLTVFFLYQKRLLCYYTPAVNDRTLTKAMQKKFREFAALVNREMAAYEVE